LFYLPSGFGILAKGPVAIVLPAGIIFLYLLTTNRLKEIKKLHIFSGLLLTALVSLPWYVAVYIATNGVWIKEFIFKHNIHRFSAPMEGHGGIFLVTFIFVFIGLLPFSVFAIQSLIKAFKNRSNDFILFNLIFASVYIVFFAISKTKLPNYTVPAYFPLAILIGYYISNFNNLKGKNFYIPVGIYILISILITIGVYIGLKNEKPVSDLSYLAFGFLTMAVFGLIALFIKNKLYSLFSISLGAVLTTILFFTVMFPPIDKRNPVQQMLPLIDKNRDVYYYRGFNPAFVFYLRKRIPPTNKNDLINKNNVYILSRKRFIKDLQGIPNLKLLREQKDLFEKYISVLLEKK
jgi:4-amino-4-deoxy-L-arabinose transferase-like glycosyltransferase